MLAVTLVGAVVGLWLWPVAHRDRTPDAADARSGPVVARPQVVPPVGPPEPPSTPSAVVDYLRRSDALVAACGLPVRSVCHGSDCATVLVSPDLDRFSGWIRLGWTSPRFVLTTAVRDLGVPVEATPCGLAVHGLVDDAGVAAVELADGTEVWCAGERSVCAAMAGEDFAAPQTRRLSL